MLRVIDSLPRAALWPSYLRISQSGLTNLGRHQTSVSLKQLASALDNWTQPKAFLFGDPVCACQHSNKLKADQEAQVFWQVSAPIHFIQPRKVQRRERGYGQWWNAEKGSLVSLLASHPHRLHNPLSIYIAFLWAQARACSFDLAPTSKLIRLKCQFISLSPRRFACL